MTANATTQREETRTLRRRTDPDLGARLALSAATTRGAHVPTESVPAWLAGHAREGRFDVEPIAFSQLEGWSFQPGTGNLTHHTGRFFSIEAMHVTATDGAAAADPAQWYQPVIHQPETGILGILGREFDGVLHFLMQAKMEPGNPNLFQLSPTVQATRSNYTRAHRGAPVPYLEHFIDAGRPGGGHVIADVLQSEHGAWFYRKSNRNIVVETSAEIPAAEGFCWLTLGQIHQLLHQDQVVNMDTRTVLACLPLGRPRAHALHTDTELRSWLTAGRSQRPLHARLAPLAAASGWTRGRTAIGHGTGRWFQVVAVSVHAGNREITHWTQPLIEPCGEGVTAFLHHTISGVPHLLARASAEPGLPYGIELGPTVQCTPANHSHLPADRRPPYLAAVLGARPDRIRYQAVHSEEGGRFRNARTRCLIVDTGASATAPEVPPDYRWVTPAQLTALAQHPHYVNVQARTLLACVHAARL